MNNSSKAPCEHNQSEGFHDCNIVGIVSDDRIEHKAEITIQCYACGARLAVVLEGLDRMSVHDFWEGNNIHDMIQYEWPDMPLEWLADVLHIGGPDDLKSKYGNLLEKIRDEKMVLVHVTPSYGCEILALCKSVTVRGR